MARLNILEYPHPRLRIKAEPVTVVDEQIMQLVDDMFETMQEAQGIGLAASQVDVQKRVIVMDISEQRDEPRVYINPEIEILEPDTTPYEEGCLSVPGFYEAVDRPAHVMIRALDRQGNAFEEEAKGLLAVCIQHEIDHLEGKLFVDYLSPLKRDRIRKKLKKQRA
ncbi:peptide deformylase [Porticoccaceae bacterium]|jgi:peptide deformylase|nr:peptide deformylase [Porticoccaceae bacterium]MDG2116539.1 peptide deformylase [Porticoccaceae bacterium]